MSIRDSINRLLGGDDDAPEDQDALIEIAVVPLGAGPMTVSMLCDAGFDASGAPTFNVVTDVASDFRILVPRRQAAAATARLDELA